MKKKILCILQLPPPVHGVSIMNQNVMESDLLKEKYRLKNIEFKFGKSIRQLEKFSFSKVFKSIFYGFSIAQNILRYKPDLIYFTIAPKGFAFYRDAYYIFLIKLLRKKILIHLHGKGIEKNVLKSRSKKALYSYTFKNIDVICLSELLSNDIKSVYKGTPFIVPNGIKTRLAGQQISKQYDNHTPQILYLSNFIKNKGILILLDALVILKNQGYSFYAKLVGAPSNVTNEMLEETIKKQNINSYIEVIGPLMGDAKLQAYNEADIFVFPTYNDAFPLVTLEAMQCSLPVISTFEGSIPDIVVDHETGFLVETENPAALAEKIAILLQDDQLRKEMGKKGRERFRNNYTLDHFEKNMFETFQTVLSE